MAKGSDFTRRVAADVTGGFYAWDVWTDPPAADADYFITTTSTAASEVVYTSADWANSDPLDPPRPVTFTANTNADFDAVDMVVTGTDIDGRALTETVTLTDGGNATDSTSACFRTVTGITIPAQSGTGGSYTIGFGAAIGFSAKVKSRAGHVAVLTELAAGSVATNGTFVAAATASPYGSYSPNTAADGSRDYAVLVELDV